MQLLLAGVLFVFAARCAPRSRVFRSSTYLFTHSLIVLCSQAGRSSGLRQHIVWNCALSKNRFTQAQICNRKTYSSAFTLNWLLSAVKSDGVM
jgi:hypothetical protein